MMKKRCYIKKKRIVLRGTPRKKIRNNKKISQINTEKLQKEQVNQMLISLIFLYDAQFQKSGSFINSHSHPSKQCLTPIRASTRHYTHQRVTPLNLANLFHSRIPSYIQNEQQALFTNPIEIQPTWNSTSKWSQS